MKKLFLGFAVVAALASCSKNEVIDNSGINGNDNPNRISFQTTTGVATRGAAFELTDLETDGNEFKVFGVSNFGAPGATNLFDSHLSDMYKYTAANAQKWDWADATSKDWPDANSGKYPLQFFAAYPTVASLVWNSTSIEVKPAPAVADQFDQLAATVAVDAKPLSGTAPMDFKHILSAIKFKLMSSDSYVINIKDVSIVNVTEKNTFDYSKGEWAVPVKSWTTYPYFKSTHANSTQEITFAAPAAALDIKSGEFADASIDDAGQMMLVPQGGNPVDVDDFKTAADAWVNAGKDIQSWPTQGVLDALATGAYLQVTYNMTDGRSYIIGKANNYVRVLFALDLTELTGKPWDMSKRYTYTLYLGTDDSTNGTVMDPDYKGEDGGDTDTPVDNPAVDPGNPVTKGKITFTVDVTGWNDQGGSSDIK